MNTFNKKQKKTFIVGTRILKTILEITKIMDKKIFSFELEFSDFKYELNY